MLIHNEFGPFYNLYRSDILKKSEYAFRGLLLEYLFNRLNSDKGTMTFYDKRTMVMQDRHLINVSSSEINDYHRKFAKYDSMCARNVNLRTISNKVITLNLERQTDDQPFYRHLLTYGYPYSLFFFFPLKNSVCRLSFNRKWSQNKFSETEIEFLRNIASNISDLIELNKEMNNFNNSLHTLFSIPSDEGYIIVDRNYFIMAHNKGAEKICYRISPKLSLGDALSCMVKKLPLEHESRKTLIISENEAYFIKVYANYPEASTFVFRLTPKIRNTLTCADAITNLTSQEKKITELVAKGYSNKEIALSLFITENTVKVHLKHIYSKMNITNRISLIMQLPQFSGIREILETG